MTKDEAEKEAKKKNSEAIGEFCPLIKDICRKDCICWASSLPRKYSNSDNYITSTPHCGNMMFWRECQP